MSARVEFFYDLSSPWTYLAFTNLWPMLQRTGEQAVLRPILVGGVFNAVNQSVYAAREMTDNRKLKHSWKVLNDWAALAGVEMNFPSKWHPAKSVNAMRFACALEDDKDALRSFRRQPSKAILAVRKILMMPMCWRRLPMVRGWMVRR